MEKTIMVGDKEVKLRASALVPRLYRFRFGRDMLQDMARLKDALKKAEALPLNATEEQRREAQFSVLDLTIFENAAYIMARHADPEVPETLEEWMEGFEMFSIYEVLPQILELWQLGCATTSSSKKK